jgi:hypothetical protein
VGGRCHGLLFGGYAGRLRDGDPPLFIWSMIQRLRDAGKDTPVEVT